MLWPDHDEADYGAEMGAADSQDNEMLTAGMARIEEGRLCA